MNLLEAYEKEYLKQDVPEFRVGDTVKVHLKIKEGERERTQVFQGTVIKRKGAGLRRTFTVRRVAFGEGVERTFLLNSPLVQKIERVVEGDVRRAKLYYLREKKGKSAKVKTKKQ